MLTRLAGGATASLVGLFNPQLGMVAHQIIHGLVSMQNAIRVYNRTIGTAITANAALGASATATGAQIDQAGNMAARGWLKMLGPLALVAAAIGAVIYLLSKLKPFNAEKADAFERAAEKYRSTSKSIEESSRAHYLKTTGNTSQASFIEARLAHEKRIEEINALEKERYGELNKKYGEPSGRNIGEEENQLRTEAWVNANKAIYLEEKAFLADMLKLRNDEASAEYKLERDHADRLKKLEEDRYRASHDRREIELHDIETYYEEARQKAIMAPTSDMFNAEIAEARRTRDAKLAALKEDWKKEDQKKSQARADFTSELSATTPEQLEALRYEKQKRYIEELYKSKTELSDKEKQDMKDAMDLAEWQHDIRMYHIQLEEEAQAEAERKNEQDRKRNWVGGLIDRWKAQQKTPRFQGVTEISRQLALAGLGGKEEDPTVEQLKTIIDSEKKALEQRDKMISALEKIGVFPPIPSGTG